MAKPWIFVHFLTRFPSHGSTFTNDSPHTLHSAAVAKVKADIVFGTEADWGQHNGLSNGQLVGFDIDLTREICQKINKKCAIVTVPWQSVWPKQMTQFGVKSNSKTYPGWGTDAAWYHCTMGTRNTIARQRSTAFTNPYTDVTKDKSGFVVPKGQAASFNAGGKRISVLASQAFTEPMKAKFANAKSITEFDNSAEMWANFTKGGADAVFTGHTEQQQWIASNSGYEVVSQQEQFSSGVAYGCRPEFGSVVTDINTGLVKVKADTTLWSKLCKKWNKVDCDQAGATFINNFATGQSPRAEHPSKIADVVFATEADWLTFNNINSTTGELIGFDVEFTKQVCLKAGLTCAMITAPWQSVWPKAWPEYGLTANSQTYPGWGMNAGWFHCSVGTRITMERQQSTMFTYAYTNKSIDKAGFVTSDAGFPNNGKDKKVAVLAAQAFTGYILTQASSWGIKTMIVKDTSAQLQTALTSNEADAVYTGSAEAASLIQALSGSYKFVQAKEGYTHGVAFGCHPKYGDIVKKLNGGIEKVKQETAKFDAMCQKYNINCDKGNTKFENSANMKGYQTHLTDRMDIVIATEADWGQYNNITDGSLVGFDVELVAELQKKITNKKLKLVTVPWQSIWPRDFKEFGEPDNSKMYPGRGQLSEWFHCSAGTRNTVARARGAAFTQSYTDPSKDKAGFVVLSSEKATFPNEGRQKTVGLLAAQAFSDELLSRKDSWGIKEIKVGNTASEVWDWLKKKQVDAVFTGNAEQSDFIKSNPNYAFVEAKEQFLKGVAFGCNPKFADVVKSLNAGLTSLKNDAAAWNKLCGKYPGVDCDKPTTSGRLLVDHPTSGTANFVFGTEANWGQYNRIKDGKLDGFDIELTKLICDKIPTAICSIAIVPWQSIWAKSFPEFSVTDNSKTYPGVGTNTRWFHCSTGTRNTAARQISTAFTDPYTDPKKDVSGFVIPDGDKSSFPVDAGAKKVGVLAAQAFTTPFKEKFTKANIVERNDGKSLWADLKAKKLDAVFTGFAEKNDFMKDNTGFAFVHEQDFTRGVAFGCHPEFGDHVAKINTALQALKKEEAWQTLCAKYPTVDADGCKSGNNKTTTGEDSADTAFLYSFGLTVAFQIFYAI